MKNISINIVLWLMICSSSALAAWQVDTTFTLNLGLPNAKILQVVEQSSGKMILEVTYTCTASTLGCWKLMRINPNGSIDTTFKSPTVMTSAGDVDEKRNCRRICCNAAARNDKPSAVEFVPIAASNTPKIIIGGNGQVNFGTNTRKHLLGMKANGSFDLTFNSNNIITQFSSTPQIDSIKINPFNGDIFVSGTFTQIDNQPRNGAGCLESSGNANCADWFITQSSNEVYYPAVMDFAGKELFIAKESKPDSEFQVVQAGYTSSGETVIATTYDKLLKINTVKVLSDGRLVVAGNFNDLASPPNNLKPAKKIAILKP